MSNIVISSQAKISPSLKVTNIQDRIVHKNELSNTNIATYEYLPDTDCTVTVELQQKVGASYQKLTDRLNQVNGTTEHSFGVYSLNANKGNNDISFVLSSFTSSGTYRLVFKVNDSDGIQILQIPYNFIVTQ